MSDSFSNPMLLNPNNPNGMSVPAIQSKTAAFPIRMQDDLEYFVCTMNNHHFLRTDGKRLAFVFNMLATRDVFDIQYMKNELEAGNPFLRKATDAEIRNYNMRIDPNGTLAKEITPAIEAGMKTRLEVELRQAMEEKMNTLGIVLTDEQKEALFIASEAQEVSNEDTSGSKVSGVDALSRLQDAIKSGTGSVVLGGIAGSDKTTTGIAAAKD